MAVSELTPAALRLIRASPCRDCVQSGARIRNESLGRVHRRRTSTTRFVDLELATTMCGATWQTAAWRVYRPWATKGLPSPRVFFLAAKLRATLPRGFKSLARHGSARPSISRELIRERRKSIRAVEPRCGPPHLSRIPFAARRWIHRGRPSRCQRSGRPANHENKNRVGKRGALDAGFQVNMRSVNDRRVGTCV